MQLARKKLLELIATPDGERYEGVVLHGLIVIARFADRQGVAASIWDPRVSSWEAFAEEFLSLLTNKSGGSLPFLKAIGGNSDLDCISTNNNKLKIEKLEKQLPLRLVVLPKEGRVLIAPEESKASSTVQIVRQAKEKVRAYIVDDSPIVRVAVKQLLSEDSRIEVIGESGDPVLAIEEIVRLRPDVITLDIHMPKLNGVQVLEQLKNRYPVPALILSSLSKEEGSLVMQALSAGAIDFVKKPTAENVEEVAKGLREKVFIAGQASHQQDSQAIKATGKWDLDNLIVIGASTGGTRAIESLIKLLPSQIPPILIVQHIPPVFSKAFADRLNEMVPFSVREAQSGERVLPNQVLVAPGGVQMGVRKEGHYLEIFLKQDPPVNGFAPSVDYLFDSVAQIRHLPKTVAALLTGMGKDGAKGLLNLKEHGVRTIAQDEATCVVFGMPGAAVRLGAAEFVEPLGAIPSRIEKLFSAKTS